MNNTNLDKVVVLIGNSLNHDTRILHRGKEEKIPIQSWRKKFAFVDFCSGYDANRKTYRAQKFKVTENCKLEMQFATQEFKVIDMETGKGVQAFNTNYQNVNPNEETLEALSHYNLNPE